MNTIVVFDCESDRVFDRTNRCTSKEASSARADQILEMQCTVACALVLPCAPIAALRPADEVLAQAVRIVCWRDVCAGKTPFADLLCAFDKAVLIYGFNQLGFDMPLLRKYYHGPDAHMRHLRHRLKCVDIFANVRILTEHWIGLGALLEANGLPGKSGSGVSAVKLWDKIQMSTDQDEVAAGRHELEVYCMDDVDRTARVALLSHPVMPLYGMVHIGAAAFGMASALAAARCAEVVAGTQDELELELAPRPPNEA